VAKVLAHAHQLVAERARVAAQHGRALRALANGRLEPLDALAELPILGLELERAGLERGPLLAELGGPDLGLGEQMRQLVEPLAAVSHALDVAELLALVTIDALDRRGVELGQRLAFALGLAD